MPGGPPTRPYPSLLFRRVRALVLLVVLICLVSLSVHLVKAGAGSIAAARAAKQVEQAAAAAPPPPTSESATAALTQAIGVRNQGVRGRLALAVTDLDTGVSAAYGSTELKFATASVVKVDILATLLLQRDGELTKSQKLSAKRMIQASDNGAATYLWRQIGKAPGLAAANQQFGLTTTVGGPGGMWGTTTTTAADQLQLMKVVFTDDSPLNEKSRAYLKSLMGSVVADQDWGISAADTREGDKFYVKNGWMPRSKGWAVNSVGFVEHAGHRLVIAALSDGRPGKDSGVTVLELVSDDAARAVVGS